MDIKKLESRINELEEAAQRSVTQHNVLIGQLQEAKLILQESLKSSSDINEESKSKK